MKSSSTTSYNTSTVFSVARAIRSSIRCGAGLMQILRIKRSHTGCILMLNGGAVSWRSTKQKSVSLSTAEAEWYAASEVGKKIIYLRAIVEQFGFTQREPTELYEDSRAVIVLSENPVNRMASRHIDTRRHYIRRACGAGTSNFDPVSDQQNGGRCLDERTACSCVRETQSRNVRLAMRSDHCCLQVPNRLRP
jgi:hypothetical protein